MDTYVLNSSAIPVGFDVPKNFSLKAKEEKLRYNVENWQNKRYIVTSFDHNDQSIEFRCRMFFDSWFGR